MTAELGIVIINRDDISRLDSILKSYTQYYVSDDIKAIVLIAEGFGAESIRTYLHRVQRGLDRVVLQNPLMGLYLPFLSVLGLRDADLLMLKLSRHVDELRRWVKELRHRIERIILSERRSNLVSLALASKYFLDILDREEYHGFVCFYVNDLLADTILSEITKRYYEDLDIVEKTSLLYLYEVINSIRERLRQPLLDTSAVKNYLNELGKTKHETFSRLATASLLYELSKLKRDKQYMFHFYELLSHIDFRTLATEIRRREEKSIEELSIYDLDEESLRTLSIPLGDIELALTAKLVNILKKEFVYVPIVGFSDFVSRYYNIPKCMLRLWLSLVSTYYCILKYLGYIIRLVVSAGSAYAVWLMMSRLNQPVQIATPTTLLSFFLVLLASEALKHLRQIAELKIARCFKEMRDYAARKMEELEYKRRFFDYLVP